MLKIVENPDKNIDVYPTFENDPNYIISLAHDTIYDEVIRWLNYDHEINDKLFEIEGPKDGYDWFLKVKDVCQNGVVYEVIFNGHKTAGEQMVHEECRTTHALIAVKFGKTKEDDEVTYMVNYINPDFDKVYSPSINRTVAPDGNYNSEKAEEVIESLGEKVDASDKNRVRQMIYGTAGVLSRTLGVESKIHNIDKEIDMLRNKNINVIHDPRYSLKLNEGFEDQNQILMNALDIIKNEKIPKFEETGKLELDQDNIYSGLQVLGVYDDGIAFRFIHFDPDGHEATSALVAVNAKTRNVTYMIDGLNKNSNANVEHLIGASMGGANSKLAFCHFNDEKEKEILNSLGKENMTRPNVEMMLYDSVDILSEALDINLVDASSKKMG